MTCPQNIIQIIETHTGHPLNPDEGLRLGPLRQPITGITVCWMATPEAIRAAARKKHNVIISHEALTYPYPGFAQMQEREYLAWPTNQQRLKLLTREQHRRLPTPWLTRRDVHL